MNTDTEKQEIKEEEVTVTKEERDAFLEDLVYKGYAVYAKDILNGKMKVKYRSLSGGDQLKLDEKVADINGSPVKVMHSHSVWLLTYTLTHYGDTNLSNLDQEQRFNFIKGKSSVIIDALSEGHNEFHRKLQAAVSGNVIEEVFLEKEPTS